MGNIVGGTDGVLFASGDSLPMRTLAGTEAGCVTTSHAVLNDTGNVSTAHSSSRSVVSMSVSVETCQGRCALMSFLAWGFRDREMVKPD